MPNRRNVLVYSMEKPSRGTVRRQYLTWRRANRMPVRCDNAVCAFSTAPLTWNGQELQPVLDHVNGNRFDNRPVNLRLLCPNCDAQLETRGGRNRGRIQNASQMGYEVAHRDGHRDANVFLTGVGGTGSVGSFAPAKDRNGAGSTDLGNEGSGA